MRAPRHVLFGILLASAALAAANAADPRADYFTNVTDDVGILDRHNVWMAQLRNQPDFSQQGLVVALAVRVGQRYLEGHPDPLDRVASLPDLATTAFA